MKTRIYDKNHLLRCYITAFICWLAPITQVQATKLSNDNITSMTTMLERMESLLKTYESFQTINHKIILSAHDASLLQSADRNFNNQRYTNSIYQYKQLLGKHTKTYSRSMDYIHKNIGESYAALDQHTAGLDALFHYISKSLQREIRNDSNFIDALKLTFRSLQELSEKDKEKRARKLLASLSILDIKEESDNQVLLEAIQGILSLNISHTGKMLSSLLRNSGHNNPQKKYLEGVLLFDNHNLEKAKIAFEKSLQSNIQKSSLLSDSCFLMLGKIYRRMKHWDLALEALSKVTNSARSMMLAKSEEIAVYLESQQYTKASTASLEFMQDWPNESLTRSLQTYQPLLLLASEEVDAARSTIRKSKENLREILLVVNSSPGNSKNKKIHLDQ